MLDAESFAGSRESERFVAAAVVGHDAIDGDAEALVVGNGGAQEGDSALLLLIWQDSSGCNPGMIVDGEAAAALLSPWSTTARTTSSRPLGVRRALSWAFIR